MWLIDYFTSSFISIALIFREYHDFESLTFLFCRINLMLPSHLRIMKLSFLKIERMLNFRNCCCCPLVFYFIFLAQ